MPCGCLISTAYLAAHRLAQGCVRLKPTLMLYLLTQAKY